ncbi:MAG: hypothetical protein J5546_12100 [Lachnospiraceae bacterium]|nr:hypothetical protein [Lachnospiraceae bacterium]
MYELPFIFPPIETYQGDSFILGIMLAYPEYADIQYNGYINLECEKTDCLSDVRLAFSDSLWEYYRVRGLAEMNLYDISNFSKKTLCQFICERIDQGNYLLFYDIDEYFLSYSDNFKRKHANHDTYVYGYSEDCFQVLAYRNEHLACFSVDKVEVINALVSKKARKNVDKSRHFCTYRPSINVTVRADKVIIYEKIKAFYETRDAVDSSQGKAQGICVYDVLLNCMKSLEKDEKADVRPFRCLWEHKKLMKERMAYLQDDSDGNCTNDLRSLCDKTEIVFRLMMKYNMTFNASIIDKAYQKLESIKQEDLMWYKKYIENEKGET